MSESRSQTIEEFLAETDAVSEGETLVLQATELIFRLLEQERVTQTTLAQSIGKTKGHVSQLLSGSRNMTLRTLAEVSHALGYRLQLSARPIRALQRAHRESEVRPVLDEQFKRTFEELDEQFNRAFEEFAACVGNATKTAHTGPTGVPTARDDFVRHVATCLTGQSRFARATQGVKRQKIHTIPASDQEATLAA